MIPKVLHMLRHGRSLCGMADIPANWPEGHFWVPDTDRNEATCEACKLAYPLCRLCKEAIAPGDRTETRDFIDSREAVHFECSARMALGSLAHVTGTCSCYGGENEETPGLTRRQEAKQVLEFFRARYGS